MTKNVLRQEMSLKEAGKQNRHSWDEIPCVTLLEFISSNSIYPEVKRAAIFSMKTIDVGIHPLQKKSQEYMTLAGYHEGSGVDTRKVSEN